MSENKLKHLEFIHSTINRMSTNSFLIKGWAVTLTSALFALAAKESNILFALITYLAIPIFWYMNGFFLMQERRFRELYDKVRTENENAIDFRMNVNTFNSGKCTLLSSMFSKSIWPLYIFIMIITCLTIIFLNS